MPHLPPTTSMRLTSSRLLARNVLFNLLGQAAPLALAFLAIPVLIRELGTDRFGVLTLALLLLGYFNLFDLGIARALTRSIAERVGTEREHDIADLIWTAFLLLVLLGVAGGIAIALLAPWLVGEALKIPQELQAESLSSFYLIALALPIVIGNAGLRAVLEALQRFGMTNAVGVAIATFNYLGPILVLPFSRSLFAAIAVLVIGRALTLLVYLCLCLRVLPTLRQRFSPRRVVVLQLLRFGSWLTVTNIIGPLMVYMDRFLLGALVSVTAVTYYATPYEIATKLWVIPTAFIGVLFPAFTTSLLHDRARTVLLFDRACTYLFIALFPISLLVVTLAHEGMDLWLGKPFAQYSAPVLQILVVGVFVNSMAHIPYIFVQSAGRPDLETKLHVVVLPFYLLALWQLTSHYGINGAAIAWTGRVLADSPIVFAIAQWLLPSSATAIRRIAALMIAALCILAVGALLSGVLAKMVFLGFTLLAFAVAAWQLILLPAEREAIKRQLGASKLRYSE
jgi:O-antigen/teichoic acid export membrane protein